MTKSEPADCCGIVHVAYSTILGNYVVLCNRQTSRRTSRLKGRLLGSETERQSNLNRLPYSSTDCPTDSKTNIKAHRQLEHQTQQQTHTLIVTCSGGDLNNFQLRARRLVQDTNLDFCSVGLPTPSYQRSGCHGDSKADEGHMNSGVCGCTITRSGKVFH